MIKIELFDNSIKLGSSEYPKNSLSLNILSGSIISISYGNKIIIESILDNFTNSSDQVYSSIDNFLVDFRECFSTSTPTPTSTGWELNGNTVGAEKFIGTLDNYAFPVRTNNTEIARFTTGGLFRIGSSATTPTAFLDVAAGTTSYASLRFRAGVAPSSPNSGDVWFDASNVFNLYGSGGLSLIGDININLANAAIYLKESGNLKGSIRMIGDQMQILSYINPYSQISLNSNGTIGFGINASENRVFLNSSGLLGIGTASPTSFLDVAASTTSNSSLRIRSGVAPTTPNDGDVWFDGTNYKCQVGGVIKTFTIT